MCKILYLIELARCNRSNKIALIKAINEQNLYTFATC